MNPDIENIARYVQENRQTYTYEAIIRQLLVAGHGVRDIDAALAAVGVSSAEISQAWTAIERGTDTNRDREAIGESQVPPPDMGEIYGHPKPSVTSSWVFWAVLVGYIALSLGLIALMNLSPSSIGLLGGFSTRDLVCWTFLAIQLIALLAGIFLREVSRPVSQGLFVGFVIANVVLPTVAFVVIVGIILGPCLVGRGS